MESLPDIPIVIAGAILLDWREAAASRCWDHMGVFGASREGSARVNRAPLLIGVVWLLTLLVSAPPALDNLTALFDDVPSSPLAFYAAATSAALWLFLTGGIIDRYARDHATGSAGFFAACGTFFFRFLRLAVVQAIVYALIFRLLRGRSFDRVGIAALVAAANVIFDYAKVRAVVEDRRSMLGAIGGAFGFLQRNSASALALFAIDFALFLLVMWVFEWAEFAIAQIFLVAVLWVKLLFWASETALFQSRLAHAGYVARSQPSWPDSPAAEAIT